jgi:long-chain acyl-CoA synthetase
MSTLLSSELRGPMLQQFVRLAAAAPDAPAVIDGETGSVTTRSALLARAGELSSHFRGSGLRAGDLVAIQLPNSVDFVAAFLAITNENLVAVPIDRDAPETEVAAILGHFAVRALVYRSGTTQISTRAVRERAAVPANARLIKLTSGSTGKPKGIVT